jgi:sugar O-acyltransferase (sialic acid O-acetyltransferase NeuD family)
MIRLALYGFGGHGKVVADAAQEVGWKRISFYDDAIIQNTIEHGWEFAGAYQNLLEHTPTISGLIVTIGSNESRLKKMYELQSVGLTIVNVIHPKSVVSRYVGIGMGSVIFAGAVVNVHTTIGDGVIINTGATVDHDCFLDDGVHVSPGAHLAGNVHVGKHSWIGIGAVVKQGIVIGDDCIIGAGSVVLNDVESGLTVVGVPAKPIMKIK